ncbi:MAG: hypothetical protein JW779_14965 [Candidatus Thorarchaeota archaeon]|nr:hypothetical protein [Candidatus Thorarchaeota archaeon]
MARIKLLQKRDLRKKVNSLESQEDALRDAKIDNRIRLTRTRNRLIEAREAKRRPTPSDVVEYKARKQAERVIENYYSAVRNAREKLETHLDNLEEGRDFLNEGIIPDMTKVMPILKEVAKVDRGIYRTIKKADGELMKLVLRQTEELRKIDEMQKITEEEMKKEYQEIDYEFEEEELEELYREIDADLGDEKEDTADNQPDKKSQKQADEDFGFQ